MSTLPREADNPFNWGPFSKTSPSSGYGESSSTGGVPSIGDIKADYVNFDNIVNNRAKSADWGAGVGGTIGAFFGAPQQGANIGRTVFPILNKTVRPALSRLWDNIAK